MGTVSRVRTEIFRETKASSSSLTSRSADRKTDEPAANSAADSTSIAQRTTGLIECLFVDSVNQNDHAWTQPCFDFVDGRRLVDVKMDSAGWVAYGERTSGCDVEKTKEEMARAASTQQIRNWSDFPRSIEY